MAKNICIYHGNCADGFAAAWVVRRHAQMESKLDEWEFYPGVYQQSPPDVTGKKVVIVDFSYKIDVIKAMLKTADSITIIDHHKTAIEELSPLMDINTGIATVGMDFRMPLYLHFDMNHSGAMLAWLYYFGDNEPPALIKHIEDRDLWKFKLEGTREIQATLFSYPYDFEVWDSLMMADPEKLAIEGFAIERKHFKDINELLAVITRRMIIGGFNVPVANLPYTLSSDAGHKLAKGEPFGVCYWDAPDGRVFSLRSTDDAEDVSVVAKQYGGGGHRNASGFKLSFEEAKKLEVAV